MRLSIEEIIQKVIEYSKNNLVHLMNDKESYKKVELKLIVGDSKYPTRKNGPINVSTFGEYTVCGFTEVAFLCDRKTLELFSIIGIFLDSIDEAAKLINMLLSSNLMDAFAKYLFYEHNVMLVNANGNLQNIDNLLAKFPNHKVLFCWGKKKCHAITKLNNLKRGKTNKKYDYIIRLKHPSSHSYASGFENTCSCYMDRTYRDTLSNLSIQDFKIF